MTTAIIHTQPVDEMTVFQLSAKVEESYRQYRRARNQRHTGSSDHLEEHAYARIFAAFAHDLISHLHHQDDSIRLQVHGRLIEIFSIYHRPSVCLWRQEIESRLL